MSSWGGLDFGTKSKDESRYESVERGQSDGEGPVEESVGDQSVGLPVDVEGQDSQPRVVRQSAQTSAEDVPAGCREHKAAHHPRPRPPALQAIPQ